jgi:hypothetical protein
LGIAGFVKMVALFGMITAPEIKLKRIKFGKDIPGRNRPCPCGSGKKYKMCCLNKEVLNDPTTRSSG